MIKPPIFEYGSSRTVRISTTMRNDIRFGGIRRAQSAICIVVSPPKGARIIVTIKMRKQF